MARVLADMSLVHHCQNLSSLNASSIALINALATGSADVTLWGETLSTRDFANHFDNRDPSTAGGAVPGDVSVTVYYAPSNDKEYTKYDTIKDKSWASGRRRICMRVQAGRAGGNDLVSFYLTSHPKSGGNYYVSYTPINPAK